MKPKIYMFVRLFILIFLFASATNISAQITVKTDITEKAILDTKPIPYDSLTNLTNQENPIDFKQYIGLKLFFIPVSIKYYLKNSQEDSIFVTSLLNNKKIEIKNPNAIPFEETSDYNLYILGAGRYTQKDIEKNKNLLADYNEKKASYENKSKIMTSVYLPYYSKKGIIATNRKKVESKYFTILNIKGYDPETKKYVDLANIDKNVLLNGEKTTLLSFKLRNDETSDTLYWVIQSNDIEDYLHNFSIPFLLVPYFTKQKQLFEGITFTAQSDTLNLVDINTGKIINVKVGDKWKCDEVSLLELEAFRYLVPYYIFKNEKGEEIKIKLGELSEKLFMTEEQFKQCELKNKMSTINNLIDLYTKERKISIDSVKKYKKSFVIYFNNVKFKLDTAKVSEIEKLLIKDDEVISKLSAKMTEKESMAVILWDALVRERLKRLLCKY